jgi:hypothetical protein
MDLADIVRSRISNQRLGPQKHERPDEVVAWLGAVQAQDFAAAKWALGQRLTEATDSSIEKAFNEGTILRTHVMRPTWHFVTPRDIRTLLALTAPRVHARNARMYRRLELDADLLLRCHAVFTEALQGGNHLTRAELAERLAEKRIEARGQRLAYILMHAELEGLICSGPRRGKQFTYALLEERAPREDTLSREEALAQWTLRYFVGHGPAQVKDLAWWLGLTLGDARHGLELAAAQLASEVVQGQTYWFSPQAETANLEPPAALLLSIYDEYIIAYRDRRALSKDRSIERLLSLGNAATSVLVLDGRAVGTWKRVIKRDRVELTTVPFRSLRVAEHEAIGAAAARFGAFLEMPVVVGQT